MSDSVLSGLQDAIALLLVFAGMAWFAVTWATTAHWPMPLLATLWPAPILFGLGLWLWKADLPRPRRT